VTGDNFSTTAGATAVSFGSAPAAGVTCPSVMTCTATSPAGSGIVDVRSLPQLQHHEGPETVTVVGARGGVLVEDARNGGGIEPAA